MPEGQSEPEQGRETSGAAATIEGHGDCVMQAFCDAAPASRSEALVRAAVGYLFSERSDVVQAMLAFTAEAGAQCARVTADANCPSCWLALFCGTSPASMTDEMVKAAVRAMAQYR